RPQALIGAKQIRTRVLTDDELRKVWHAAASLSEDYRDAVRLLMLTGTRRNEVAHARRGEFKMMSKVWRLPSDRTKSAAPHSVPMSRAIMAILLPHLTCKGEDDDYLFGRKLNGWS